MSDFEIWTVMVRETKHPAVAEVECFGVFESEQEANEAARIFLHSPRWVSVHRIDPLPTGEDAPNAR